MILHLGCLGQGIREASNSQKQTSSLGEHTAGRCRAPGPESRGFALATPGVRHLDDRCLGNNEVAGHVSYEPGAALSACLPKPPESLLPSLYLGSLFLVGLS